jgi:starvation-inducible outer membrane lipoprotein
MKRLLLLTAIFLSGCVEVQQNIKNSIHKEKRDIYDCFFRNGCLFRFFVFLSKERG